MLKLDKNKKYLLACSYGPDSMYLFTMLKNEGYKFAVAHVNYHFRKESDNEEKNLREYCKANNVELYIYDNKEEVKSNLEERAREIRYNFFKSVYDKYQFDALVVAHNKDDHLETYLLQKQRKNLPIFYGINSQNIVNGMVVIRPMLDMYKEDIIKYNDEHNVSYSIDKTNLENTYLRNRIRNEVLVNYSKEQKEELLQEIADKNIELEKIKCKLNNIDIHSIEKLENLSLIELAYAITNLIREELPDYECSIHFVGEIMKVLGTSKSNVMIKLNDTYALCKEYDKLYVRDVDISFDPIVVESPKIIDNEFFYFDLKKCGENKGIHQEDYPLIIRPAKKGDRYIIKDYETSVNRLFIDWKMPVYLRKIWPVFEHDGCIIYIPRYQNNFNIENDKYFFVKYGFTLKK